MYDIRRGDIVVTVTGHILKVRSSSPNWVYGENITTNELFMFSRTELNKRIKEVYYNV